MAADKKGRMIFKDRILAENWTSFTSEGSPTQMARSLDSLLQKMITECFPTVKHEIRSSDDPWITPHIRKLINTRKREFKKHKKRTPQWKRLKGVTDEEIKKSKQNYFEHFKEKAAAENNPSLYYKVVNMLRDKEKPEQFDITKLHPEQTDQQTADELTEFFGAILHDDEKGPLST